MKPPRDFPVSISEPLEPRTLLAATGLPHQIGGTGFDVGTRVLATPDGGTVDAGLFSGTVDFDPSSAVRKLTAKGDTDVFIAKFSATGALQWVHQLGGTGVKKDDITKADYIDFAADPIRAGNDFVNGVSSQPRDAAEVVTDLALAPDGGIILSGDFVGNVDLSLGAGKKIVHTYDNSYYNGFVLKLSAAGTFVWADNIGGRFTDTVNAISIDSTGNIFATGIFSRDVTFNTGNAGSSNFSLSSDGRADGYIMKLATGGNIRWVTQFGGDATDFAARDAGIDVATDAAGNAYVVGTYDGNSTFYSASGSTKITLQSNSDTDGFLARYTSAGKLSRAVSIAGDDYDGATNVAVDSQNNVVVSGYFAGENFDADPTSRVHTLVATPESGDDHPKLTDVYVEKLDANFRLVWVQQLAGTGQEFASSMAIDSSDNIILGGSYYGTARFGHSGPTIFTDPGENDFKDTNDKRRDRSYDAYLWKLSSSGATTFVKKLGAAGDDFGEGVAIAADDSILFTGRFRGTVDFDTTAALRRLRAQGLGDAFIAGFTAGGAPIL